MNEEFSNNNFIDAELQVRLMNLVMGESSDFESDQLHLMMEQRAEVAAHYEHLKHLHGLLSDVGAGDPSMDIDPANSEDLWQLSLDRRKQLLAVLDNNDHTPAKVVLAKSMGSQRWSMTWMESVMVASIACVLLGLMLPSVPSARSVARKFNVIPSIPSATLPERAFFGRVDSPYDYYAGPKETSGNADTKQNGERNQFGQPARGGSLGYSGYAPPSSSFPVPKLGSIAGAVVADDQNGRLGEGGIANSGIEGRELRESNSWQDKTDAKQKGYQLDLFHDGIDSRSSSSSFDEPRKADNDGEIAELSKNTTQEFGDIASIVPVPRFGNLEVETTLSVPDGGMITLGGIKKLRAEKFQIDRDPSTLMRNVTPRILIPEEEESSLGNGTVQNKELNDDTIFYRNSMLTIPLGISSPDFDSNIERFSEGESRHEGFDSVQLQIESLPNDKSLDALLSAADGREYLDFTESKQLGEEWLKRHTLSRNDPVTARDRIAIEDSSKTEDRERPQLSLGDLGKDVIDRNANTRWYADRASGLERKSETVSEDFAGREQRSSWMFNSAPSPEIDARSRYRVEVAGKPLAPKQAEAINEQSASLESFSTFSLHVSDVSFKLAHAALSQGQWPEAAKIRIEEFVNALDYHDPLPTANQKVACRVEQAIHPFLMQRNLLRVSMRTAATGRSQNIPLRLTLLLDNSGSMERPDRRQAVMRAFQTLTAQLGAADQVTLISFASTPRLLADNVPGNQGESLLQLIENLPSEGGTNIEAALLLAKEKATEKQLAGAQNRIVLMTDGAVNLGDANPESLAKLVTQLRDNGIAFDAAGICEQDLNDEVLETLTRQGDGRYYLIDSAEAASQSFASQIAGALRPSAQNVKVQVEFNPKRVGRYKLLGFEKHRLSKEDFRNDQVDAAEMAAAETGVAVYQFEIKPNGSGDVGSVSVRFRDLSTSQMVERRWPIPYETNAASLEHSGASMQLAASAALFAAKLAGGPLSDSIDLAPLQKLLSNLSDQCANQPRVQQLRTMIEQARAISP